MKLNSLFLKNYRNIEECSLELTPRLNIFIGDNGQGKTNFLESVHLLLHGESFRYGTNATLIQFKQSQAVLNTFIHNNELDYKVQMLISETKKEILLNGKRATKLEKYLPAAVLFSPESLSIIKESSDERRGLIDDVIHSIYKNGAGVISDFKKVLRTRNKILKDYSDEKISKEMTLQTLESINPSYFKLATELTCLRINSLNEIKNDVHIYLKKIDKINLADFDFEYIISDQKVTSQPSQNSLEFIHNLIQKRAQELAFAELSSGVTLVGPQKHDVIFLYNGNDSRFYCSQGQQRSIILAFKMAQIVYHKKVHGLYPILLLDDVLSELDQTKQEALILALNEIQTQTFLTTTDVDVLKKLNMDQSQIYKVRDGKINQ
jgi:DNA replication and repair protein RecF